MSRQSKGKCLHIRTIYRWGQKGCCGKDRNTVRLETTKIGGATCTSLEARQRFFDQLSGDTVTTPRVMASQGRQRQIEAAERELREAGF